MFNLLKSDVYRLVHGKMLWVGLALLSLVVMCGAGLVWFATTPEFAQMVNDQTLEEARQNGATITITSPNGADLDTAEVQALNEKVLGSRTYSYGNTFMVGFLGLIAAVLAELLASSDFETGFAKNVLAGRGDRRAYFAEKLVLIALLCGFLLLAGMLLSDVAYAVLGFSYERTETAGEYWSWAGLSWLVLTAYAFLAALIAWATRSKVAGVVFAALVPTGFVESMALGAAAVLAPAMPLVGDAMQWLPLSVQQRLAAGGTALFEAGGSAVAGLSSAAQGLIVFGAIAVVCAALALTACRRRDV
ncbi:hypothetical protein [Arabiibacter massiliensis]|uniref:hypothetical protein n=1 Tax=Arabiibacter massiliensis TaxID=1870985 RepID=UPI0009BBFC14|nr:hypothetical protein [Arabiibacter massiliensis]